MSNQMGAEISLESSELLDNCWKTGCPCTLFSPIKASFLWIVCYPCQQTVFMATCSNKVKLLWFKLQPFCCEFDNGHLPFIRLPIQMKSGQGLLELMIEGGPTCSTKLIKEVAFATDPMSLFMLCAENDFRSTIHRVLPSLFAIMTLSSCSTVHNLSKFL